MGARTREDARQAKLDQLRSRPRSKDTPHLTAHFAFQPETLHDGVSNFLDLASRLVGTNRYVERWRHVRTPAEQKADAGLDIIARPQEFAGYLREKGASDTSFLISTTSESDAIPKPDPAYFTASIDYSGGTKVGRNNRLSFSGKNYSEAREHTLSLNEWINVISQIVEWRTPLFVAVGSRNYPIHDAVFDHRAWPGWMAWFPTRIDAHGLPAYALTVDIGEGTLVATQETNVITTDPLQVERAKEVEIALVEMGVLPTKDDLIGRVY
ncbi:hypothetical protein [Terasakiella pusilla]|uniref:hypothetical protein n=1 Tax=Terasakiella pusilla TaxID=64973 RepID=UPI003AA90BAC